MKIIIVDNPHDVEGAQLRERIQNLAAKLTEPFDASDLVTVVDFMTVREALPTIRTAPTILLAFDELEGRFDPAIVKTVAAAIKHALRAP